MPPKLKQLNISNYDDSKNKYSLKNEDDPRNKDDPDHGPVLNPRYPVSPTNHWNLLKHMEKNRSLYINHAQESLKPQIP